jgi:hypothetical protein
MHFQVLGYKRPVRGDSALAMSVLRAMLTATTTGRPNSTPLLGPSSPIYSRAQQNQLLAHERKRNSAVRNQSARAHKRKDAGVPPIRAVYKRYCAVGSYSFLFLGTNNVFHAHADSGMGFVWRKEVRVGEMGVWSGVSEAIGRAGYGNLDRISVIDDGRG